MDLVTPFFTRVTTACVHPVRGDLSRKPAMPPLPNVSLYRRCLAVALAACLFLLPACSPAHHVRDADREVYGIIAEKQRRVFGQERPFSIGDPVAESPPVAAPGDVPADLVAPHMVLAIDDAMSIAFLNNREYQSRKESVYARALTLTSRRDDFTNIWGASADLSAERDTADDTSGAVDVSAGFSRLLANGARFTLNIASAASQFFTGSPDRAASSLISLSFVQPLLRNAGRLVNTENLTQAERDVVYEVRSFARFQQTFAVAVFSEYLRVLLRERVVQNQRLNYEIRVESTAKIKAFAEEDRVPQFEYEQSRQQELAAENSYIGAKEDYESALDNFKITLGIPANVPITLDSTALDALTEKGLVHPDISLPASIDTSLEKRYDYLTDKDRVVDRERKLAVAARQLGAEASLSLSADVGTPGESPLAFDLDEEGRYGVGLGLDLPLERTDERNAYRQAIINLDQTRRDRSLAADRIILQVRDTYRRLGRARESYYIQEQSVSLNEGRVESTTLLLEDGRVQTRDLLDAQADLVNARNELARAVVDHTVARLEFYRDIGTLYVDEEAPMEGIRKTETPPEDISAEPPSPESPE